MRRRAILSKMASDDIDDDVCSNERPLIDVRTSGTNIRLRVFCEKKKGVLANVITTMEGLNLSIANVNYVPFGDAYVDINIIAELQADCTVQANEVKEAIQATLQVNE